MTKILVISKLPPIKLTDKIYPLKLALPNTKIVILRRFEGSKINGVEYLIAPKCISKSPILGTISIFLLGLIKFREINPIVILSYYFLPHGLIALFYGMLFRRKTICSIIGDDKFVFENKILSSPSKLLLKKASAIVVTGNNTKRKFSKIVEKNNLIIVIPNTKRITSKKMTPINKRKFDFIYLGTLTPGKQVNIIIEAFSEIYYELKKEGNEQLPSLLIVGDGPERCKLEKLFNNILKINNIFIKGYRKDVDTFLSQTKYILLASDSEGLPAVLIEGMNWGLIPITTDVGDIMDIVSKENGYLVHFDKRMDKSEFKNNYASAMREVLKLDLLEKLRLSKLNVEICEKFDYSYGGFLWRDLIFQIFKD